VWYGPEEPATVDSADVVPVELSEVNHMPRIVSELTDVPVLHASNAVAGVDTDVGTKARPDEVASELPPTSIALQ
jgi:hypothetical protein